MNNHNYAAAFFTGILMLFVLEAAINKEKSLWAKLRCQLGLG
jgi:hypothetical protein